MRVRLLFVDDGAYREETVALQSGEMDRYERLIDFILEDPAVLRRLHVDVGRLCAAYQVDDEG